MRRMARVSMEEEEVILLVVVGSCWSRPVLDAYHVALEGDGSPNDPHTLVGRGPEARPRLLRGCCTSRASALKGRDLPGKSTSMAANMICHRRGCILRRPASK